MPCSRPRGCSSAWASGPKSMAHKLAPTGREAPVGGPAGRAHLCLRRLPPRPARLPLLVLSPNPARRTHLFIPAHFLPNFLSKPCPETGPQALGPVCESHGAVSASPPKETVCPLCSLMEASPAL